MSDEAPEDGGRDGHTPLRARLAIIYYRGLRLAVMRPLAGVALPLWLHWLEPFLPPWLVWPLLIMQGLLLALLGAYAVLEVWWTLRLARRPGSAAASGIHVVSTPLTDFRFGLLGAVALLSIGPWLAAAFGWWEAPGLLADAMRAGLLTAVAAFVLESLGDGGELRDYKSETLVPRRPRDVYGPSDAR